MRSHEGCLLEVIFLCHAVILRMRTRGIVSEDALDPLLHVGPDRAFEVADAGIRRVRPKIPDVAPDGGGQVRGDALREVRDAPSQFDLLDGPEIGAAGVAFRPDGRADAAHRPHVARDVHPGQVAQASVGAGALVVETVVVVVGDTRVVEIRGVFHIRGCFSWWAKIMFFGARKKSAKP